MTHNIKLDVTEDVKNLVGSYTNYAKQKQKYVEEQEDEDEYDLCFRICTGSGTKISIPSPILRDSFIAAAVFVGLSAVAKIVGELISSN